MNENDNWEDLIDRHLSGEVDNAKKERFAELLDSLMIQHHQVVPNIAGVPAGHHPLSHHGQDFSSWSGPREDCPTEDH
jgi:hypothetical protein